MEVELVGKNKNMVISIIGCGGVGSRHLQAITKTNRNFKIECVDTNPQSIQLSKQRLKELKKINFNHISFHNSIDKLSNVIDICIIATKADIRKDVIVELVNKKQVKYLIIEKVAFQESNDFKEVIDLLEKRKIKCWVNCHLRAEPLYQELKDNLNLDTKTDMIYSYPESFNLATCLIHIVDLFCYLTNNNEYKLDLTKLEKRIYKSRHEGCIELKGIVKITNKEGHSLVAHKGSFDVPQLYITNKNHTYNIFEQGNKFKWQSDLSHLYVEDILENELCCQLPTLQESFKIHKIMLQSLSKHLNIKKVNIT